MGGRTDRFGSRANTARTYPRVPSDRRSDPGRRKGRWLASSAIAGPHACAQVPSHRGRLRGACGAPMDPGSLVQRHTYYRQLRDASQREQSREFGVDRPRIPRIRQNDYTEEAPPRGASSRRAERRPSRARRLLLDRPRRSARQHRELHRRRPGADRPRRPAARRRRIREGRVLRADGDRRGHPGRQLQPRHEAAAPRPAGSRRRSSKTAMQRAPSFIFPSAREARAFGEWLETRFEPIKEAAEATTSSGKLQKSSSTRRAGSSSRASTTRPATPPART